MEEAPSVIMERAGKIIRLSIHTFLKEFQYFTTTPVLLMLPFSASVLLSLAVFPSSSSPPFSIIHAHFKSLLHAAGFSLSWLLVSLFNLNLSLIICYYLLCLPLILSSFVIGKASIIQALNGHRRSLPLPFSSFRSLYKPLLITHLCNLILNITINVAAMNTIRTFVFLFNNPIFLMVTRTVFYIILANMMVVGNLALVVAGMENCIGIWAIRKALLLRRGTNSMALLLALPLNCGLAATEALFRFRVVRAYHLYERLTASMALEGLFVAYLYSLLLVLETIACCLFFKSCTSIFWTDEIDGYYDIELPKEEDEHPPSKLRTSELP
ncbi:hypothetical protein I3760_03G015000 [Carya illinoinensis]|uniref:Transmembrane protein n=1 Tax=Carya illinoinensis TaxID=32201 RepID=A0A922FGE7_CARIL|nr:hypothetical protein I3760_03G015000 [Carya illinoinensis]KAG2714201.1 hypothetical protein I3760_03G015000 [Carya illinoinensis]KAG6719642.1 hypothetical protein I3842_03G015900 [Carya illinoinensis]